MTGCFLMIGVIKISQWRCRQQFITVAGRKNTAVASGKLRIRILMTWAIIIGMKYKTGIIA